jgi:hypothetical protein
MPLIKSPSKKAVSKNIAVEMDAGKPQKQSIAIALDIQRRAKRKKLANGGELPSIHSKDEKEMEMMKDMPSRHDEIEATHEHMTDIDEARDERDLAMMAMGGIAERIRHKEKMMAKGGEVDLQDSNGDEHLNEEDQLSYEAARKKTYYDLDQLDDQPMDSNEHGDEHEKSMEDDHDGSLVDKIRKSMRKKSI